jgi:hypothetical protein
MKQSDFPVEVGSMLFTMVDPNRGHEKAYNRWYERDHYYGGCMIGAGWFAGSRWVAPRELKDLRFPANSPFAAPLDAGSWRAVGACVGPRGSRVRMVVSELRGELLYFSMVTITTVGYGDVLAVSPTARMLAIIEAVLGQFFVAVLVGMFVGMYASQLFENRGASTKGRRDVER